MLTLHVSAGISENAVVAGEESTFVWLSNMPPDNDRELSGGAERTAARYDPARIVAVGKLDDDLETVQVEFSNALVPPALAGPECRSDVQSVVVVVVAVHHIDVDRDGYGQ